MIDNLKCLNFDDLLKNLKNNKYDNLFYISNDFINFVLSFEDPVKFRFILYALEDKCDITVFEERFNRKIEKIINKTKNGMLDIFNDLYSSVNKYPIEGDLSYLESYLHGKWYVWLKDEIKYSNEDEELEPVINFVKKINKYTLINYVIEYIFHDIFNNVIIDIEQMINYDKDNLYLSKEDLIFYQKTIKLDSMAELEILDYFNEYKNSNCLEKFYDNITRLKDNCCKELANSTTKIDESTLDKKRTNDYGVPVYYYEGNPFTCFTRCLTIQYDKVYDDSYYQSSKFDGYSFSYLNQRKLHFFRNPKRYVTFMYNNIDPKDILHVYHADSFSDVNFEKSMYVSERPFEIYTPEKLLLYTMEGQVNEVVIKSNGEGIKPSAIFMIDSEEEDKKLLDGYQKRLDELLQSIGNDEGLKFVNKDLVRRINEEINSLKNKKKIIGEIANKFGIPIVMLNPNAYKYSIVMKDDFSMPQTYIRNTRNLNKNNSLGRRS